MAGHPELDYPGIAVSNMVRDPWIRLAEQLRFPVLKSKRMYERFLPVLGETKYEDVTAETLSVMLGLFAYLKLGTFGESLYPESMANRNYK